MSDTEVLDAPAKVAEYKPVDAGLAKLRKDLAGVQFDVTTTAGDKAARAARQECVSLRTSVEAIRKAAKAPLLEKGKLLDAEATRITGEIKAIEDPIDAQIKAEEQRKAAIKAERERIERERQEGIQARISELSQYPLRAMGKTSAVVAQLRREVASLEITEEVYGQRGGEAIALQADIHAKLEQMEAAALAQEQEAARLAAERAELERQRQEQEAAARREREAEAARLAAERAELEAEQKRLQAERDAENERQAAAKAEQDRRDAEAAAELRRQQEDIDRQRRELEERQQAEQRAAAEKAAAEARAKAQQEAAERAAAEAAEKERLAEAARREAEEFAVNGPGEAEILRVLAEHYDVDTDVALGWILRFDIHHIPA